MALINENSCACVSSQLDLFTVPGTLTSQEKNSYVQYYPIATLDDGPIEFDVKQSPMYTDLSDTRLYLRCAKLILLQILNQSWTEKSVPGVWRGATIIPILKRGKPADKLSSYRPISLTSNVSKLMERLVKERLQTWLEQNGKLNKMQSGFRAQHATTDHVMRMTQMIADNFQVRKRTVLTLIDYAKAFDSVWRPGLYHKMAEMGIPGCYINWTRQFLSDRSARVCVNGTSGRAGKLKAGVPQGGVLSPLLFLIYINNALDDAPNDVHYSMFADDIAIWTAHQKYTEAKKALQLGLDALERWSKKWKMQINTAKCETTLFSKDPHEARVEIELKLNGEAVPFNKTPTFLGICFDRTLSFNQHAKQVKQKMEKRLNTLRVLSGTSWGCQREDLRLMYLSYVRSVVEYCGGAWMSSLSKTATEQIQVSQNKAARIITAVSSQRRYNL